MTPNEAIQAIEDYFELYGRKERNWIPPSREEWISGEELYNKAIITLKKYIKEEKQ